ncbi:epidermal differentiation-specific protein-like [Anneissia japonica]|uniref:epidermal differentiation-specific protein-like n=1 Tax=Anneissia japonica TaxID=1529436 RepID=UPI00142579F5|nr:epidermal differentiation-specific protein-like [Anneissia japonica]
MLLWPKPESMRSRYLPRRVMCLYFFVLFLFLTNQIIIYQDTNFKGTSRELTSKESNLSSIGFNDRVSSIRVIGSVWVGYEHSQYKGRQYILEEGDYSTWRAWQGSNDQLSSLKKLNLDIGETPQITLYQHNNYSGRAVNFTYKITNLSYYRFNDEVSSVKVKSGVWILYEHANFNGKQWVVTEGSYYSACSFRGENDKVSSLRPIKEPFHPTEVLSMEFDIAAGLLNQTPSALVNLSQRNDTSTDQQASWSTKRIATTTKTYEWHWENSTAISVDTEFKVGVPLIGEGSIKIGVANTFAIGQDRGEQNTQSDEWTFNLPATVKAGTIMRAQVNIQHGKIDVPFVAVLKKGYRRWTEKGTYKGTQSFNLQVDYNETPLEK